MDAHIDGDILVYHAGFAADKDTTTDVSVSLANVKKMLAKKVHHVMSIFNIKNVYLYITADDKSNFRYKVATSQPYKGNRAKGHRPIFYSEIREYLVRVHSAKVVTGEEADDELGRQGTANPHESIILSSDKDLRMIPGWHWEMGDRMPYFVTDPGYLVLEEQRSKVEIFGTGHTWFSAQLLMGDRADNIPGLPGYGVVKTWETLSRVKSIKKLDLIVEQCYTEQGMEARLEEIRSLVWIRRT